MHAVDKHNIKPFVWDEVLRPGALIQGWKTRAGAVSATGKGHSFIFIEYVYSTQPSPPEANPKSWLLFGGTGTPLSTGGEELQSGTYRVPPRHRRLRHVAGEFGVPIDALEEANPDKVQKPTKKKRSWLFRTGETVQIPRSAVSARTMRNVHLVGMRITDQFGYHFIPKDNEYITPRVLPGQSVDWPIKQLARWPVWFAANL
jgi:hypothetical protein